MRRGAILGGLIAIAAAGGAVAHAESEPSAEVPAARVVSGQLVLADASQAPQVNRRSPDVVRSRGYRGTTRAPRAQPAAPPAPAKIGEGENPDVYVDPAGTSHIVFNEDVTPPAPDVTHYCRLPRGATACDNPGPTPMPIDVEYASDDAGPKIFGIGDQLVVLTHRYPPLVAHPDGETRDRTTYAWTSSDGGTTWTGPGIVGTTLPSGDAALVGRGDDPRIATITASFTGGTFAQLIDAGAFTAEQVQLGADPDAYEGTIAPDGDAVVAAFADRAGGVTLRRLPAAPGWADAGAWSAAELPDQELPRLAGGAQGAYLLSHGERWAVRPVSGGTPGAPVTISGKDTAEARDLAMDAAGRVHAAFVDTEERHTAMLRSSADGRSFGAPFPIVRADQIDDLALQAAQDGGGVLVSRLDPTGTFRGTIGVSAFGTLSPTGVPGAGSLQGTGVPGGFAGCRSAGFGDVELTPRAGCLLESRDPRFAGAFVSRSEVDLNGLVLVPDKGVSIVFDPRKRTLNTTGKVRVLLRGPAIGEIELAHIELHAELGATEGQSLFERMQLPAGANIKGFPIDADFDVKIAGRGVAMPVSLKLPPALGGVSAAATLRAERGTGAVLESFRLSVGLIPLGPVTLEGLTVAYDGTAERWTGEMGVKLPLGALKATVVFEGGRFVSGRFELRPPRPGIIVFKETYFTGVEGGLTLDPVSVQAGASFGFVYHPPPADVFLTEVAGSLTVTIRDAAAELKFVGTGKLYGTEVGQWTALMTTDGYARITGGYSLDLDVVHFDGNVDGFVDAPTEQFGATFAATFQVLGIPISGGRGAISNLGVGGCVTAPALPPATFKQTVAGVGYAWGGKASLLFGETCGLERYTVAPPPGRAGLRQAAGAQAFSLPGGLEWANVEVSGESGAPQVDVVAPDGRRVAPQAPGAPGGDATVSSVPVDAQAQTIIVLDDPPAGDWQIVAREGSPPITGIRVAQSVGELRLDGRVTGKGRARTLRWSAGGLPPGTTLRFVEEGGGVTRELGTSARARGTLKIAPAPGPAGERTIQAIPEREGLPGAPVRTATYRAPAARRLAPPRGVRLSGRSARWRKVPGATGYVATATLASGRTVAVELTVPRLRAEEPIRRLRVAARDGSGGLGRPASARR